MRKLSAAQARRFVLFHQGLLGGHRFAGSEGVLAFTRQAGCVQFDPVTISARSAELVYLSRVLGFENQWLLDLLYRERALLDHFDKNLAIIPREDWPSLSYSRGRWAAAGRSSGEVNAARDQVLRLIAEKGPQSAASLELAGRVDWYWAPTTLARAALEQLYYEGELLVSSKQGTVKTYDLASRCLPRHLLDAAPPFLDERELAAWQLVRRVRALGLMWNRASDAWLGTLLYKAGPRSQAFMDALDQGRLVPVDVEGFRDPLYLASGDEPALEAALAGGEAAARCELLAPLDSLLWDRRLVEALFHFRYTWEIYTPPQKRVYGAYVLPILYGERLVARAEPVCDRKAGRMVLRGLWWEEGQKPGKREKAAVDQALHRLAGYTGCALL